MTDTANETIGDLEGEAHLYLAAPSDWTTGDELERSLTLLSDAERGRYERFRVAAPARAFATGRALARRVLSAYADVAPGDWRLEPDEHGRPRILESGTAGGLDFNLSHNDHFVACLVTGGVDCGVDVEAHTRRVDPLRIAGHSFGEEETEDLAALTGPARKRRFFFYWTLKEAYLKARGRGIAMRLDSVLFRFLPAAALERFEVSFAPSTGDRAEDWQLALFAIDEDQLLAVALRRADGRDHEIRIFRARPDELRGRVDGLAPAAVRHAPPEAPRC